MLMKNVIILLDNDGVCSDGGDLANDSKLILLVFGFCDDDVSSCNGK